MTVRLISFWFDSAITPYKLGSNIKGKKGEFDIMQH
jgi:hypothetical protein